jgi:hypothetical protein
MSSMLLPKSCPIRQMPAIRILRDEKSDSTVAAIGMHTLLSVFGIILLIEIAQTDICRFISNVMNAGHAI